MMDHTYAESAVPSGSAGQGLNVPALRQTRRGWTKNIPMVPNQQGNAVLRKFQDSVLDIFFFNLNAIKDPEYYLRSMAHVFNKHLSLHTIQWGGLKFSLWLKCKYSKPFVNNLQQSEILVTNFKTLTLILLQDDVDNLDEILNRQFEKTSAEMDSFQWKSSGWSLLSVEGVLLSMTKYRPLKGGSKYIDLPCNIKNTHSVLNVRNRDDFCFKYAILGAFTSPGQPNTNRPRFYNDIQHKIDFSEIRFPVDKNSISVFEKRNNASVNLYALDDDNNVYPYRVSKLLKKVPQHFNLLYLKNGEKNTHYCYIRNLSRLVHKQVTRHNGHFEICERCFKTYHGGDAKNKLLNHEEFCGKLTPCRYNFPKKDYVQFEHFQYLTSVPIVIYADIECLLEPLNSSKVLSNEQEGQSWTINRETHVPTCAGMYIKSYYPTLLESELLIFSGPDCLTQFMRTLRKVCKNVERLYTTPIPISWTPEDRAKHKAATKCEICNKCFSGSVKKLADHDHLNGSFRFSLCESCNWKLKLPYFIPVFFHNLSGYDGHFIVKKLHLDEGAIDVLAKSSENYISFTKTFHKCKVKARFLDSFRFLPTSLSKLVETSTDFPELRANFPNDADSHLLLRKGVYPYNYIKNWEVLKEVSLPHKNAFYSDLTQEDISDEDYEHAKTVWDHFGIENLMQYTELYLKSDILLLADVFENYRKISRDHYHIDPAWHFTSPGFFWEAMLKKTGVRLEILKDIDMLQFIETGIRGGITQCVQRHAVANNPLIEDTYDPLKPTNHIIYLDVNNLYGFSMGQPLPFGGFQWVENVNEFDYHNLPIDGEYGWIFDIDIEYPHHLHDEHCDLPFFPESMCPPGCKVEKLMTTLHDKHHYVTHHVNLVQALQKGLKVLKVHRILQFKQSTWLASYMDFNSRLRAVATTEFHKDYYKLANNAVFGRSMMNKRNFKDFRLVTSEEKLLKLSSKPNFVDRFIFEENMLVGVSMTREKVVFDAPIYVGFAILELSKHYMYKLFYDSLRPTLGGIDNVKLVYMDTDAFILDVKIPHIYETLNTSLSDIMDFSEYPEDHFCYSNSNKKVVGKLKDETKSVPIKEVVALRPKLYGISYGSKSILKCKGVKKSSIKRDVSFDDYLKTLREKSNLYCTYRKISSKMHEVSTTEHRKVGLSFLDDKRKILDDGVHTVPYGYSGNNNYIDYYKG